MQTLLFLNIGAAEAFIIVTPILVLMLYALYSCIVNKSLSYVEGTIWILIIFSIPILGSIAYFVLNKKKKNFTD